MPNPRRDADFRSRLRPASELTGLSTVTPASRFAMAAVRESDEYDLGPMDDMIVKVLEPLLPTYPDLQPILDVGARLLKLGVDGDRLRRQFKVEPLYGPGTRRRPTAYAVEREGIRIVLGLVSAGKAVVDGGSDNAWSTVLAQHVRRHKPAVFHTGSFARILRNKDVSGNLKTAFKSLGTRIHCFEWPQGFEMSEAFGDMAWELLAQAAHWDWVANLTRLQMGTLHNLKQGRYPRAQSLLPPGYVKTRDAAGHERVVPDETQRGAVRLLIELAAQDVDDQTAIKLLAEAGLRTRDSVDDDVKRRPLDQVKEPAVALRHLWQHLETYLTGKFPYWQRNTVPGIRSMLGLEVIKHEDEEQGYFFVELNFGLPEGGWHEEEIIRRAIDRRLPPRPKRGKSTDARKPLLGLCCYRQGDYEYRLLADDDSYTLRRRRSSGDHTMGTSFARNEGEVVGRFAARKLHRAVAQLLRSAASQAPTALPVFADVAQDEAIADALEARADAAEALAKGHRTQAALCADSQPEEAAEYRKQAEEAMAEARALRAEVTSRRASTDALGEGAQFQVDAQQLLVVAELLERTDNLAEPRTCQAVRGLIETLNIDSQRHEPLAEAHVALRLRTSMGTLIVGPLSTPLQNTAGRRKSVTPIDADRSLRLLHRYMTGINLEALRQLEGMSTRSENRRLVDVLQTILPHPASAAVLVDCPVTEVRAAVLSRVFEDAGLSPLQGLDDVDPRWVDELQSVYLGDTWSWRHPTWATRDYTAQRQTLTWIHRHTGPAGIDLAVVKERLHLSDPELYFLLSTDPNRYEPRRAGTWAPLEYVHEHTKHATLPDGAHRLVTIRPCPNCGQRLPGQILRVPELPQGWICSACRRAPRTTMIYPHAYLEPWVGSQLGQRQVRTDEQVDNIEKAGTRLHAVNPPPFAGRPPA